VPKNFQNERSKLLFINCFALMIYLEVSYLKAMFGDCAQEQSSGTAQAAQGYIDHTRYMSYWVYRQIGLFAVLQIFVLLLLGLLSSSFGLSGCSVGG
jgi:hypothetical protein